jgi:hypothetical protein
MELMQASSLLKFVVVAFGLIHLACPFHKNESRPIGPEVKVSLAIYFKQGVTNEQIEKFWHEVLSRPDPEGKGHYHREGVGDISRIFPPVQGHEGIAMSFLPDATAEEREAIKRSIRSAPIVYRVLENVAPVDVKDVEAVEHIHK